MSTRVSRVHQASVEEKAGEEAVFVIFLPTVLWEPGAGGEAGSFEPAVGKGRKPATWFEAKSCQT